VECGGEEGGREGVAIQQEQDEGVGAGSLEEH
jgi:hypothetical protein